MNKIDWNIVSIILSILIVTVGWGVSVEIRMAQHASMNDLEESIDHLTTRVSNLEELLIPIIVDYRVQKEVEITKKKETIPPPMPPMPPNNEKPKDTPMKPLSQVISDAERWTQEAITRGQNKKKRN